MKRNIDLFKDVSEFKEGIKTSQRTEMKLVEVSMMLANFEDQITEIKHYTDEGIKHDVKEYMDDELKLFQDEFHDVVREFEITKVNQHIENAKVEFTIASEKLDAKIDVIKKQLKEDYIDGNDLMTFKTNIERLLQELIEDCNLATTPKVNIELDTIRTQLKQLSTKQDVLFSKVDSIRKAQV
ncbi:MAG: hypothetical protein JKY54_06765, partial [Flavobacteriales bacterium]|nr:hypothetical protein [Flavobacteriales bacterium]